jgi:glycosyltransferase involved in cell wall biosynthesis
MSGEHMPMPRSEPVIAASIGSGRGDRGYFLIADIVRTSAIASRHPILFEVQSMPQQDHAYRRDYEAILAAMPTVHILPAILTDEEILDCYRRSYVAVLPYDPKVYERRGSAVYQEAIAFTRPVVCLAGTAFADLIERYENGYVCANVDEIVAAIDDCAAVPPAEWDRRLTITRSLYEMDVNGAIRELLDD